MQCAALTPELTLMPEADTELERLLTQRANRPLGQLCNFVDRGSGPGMSAKFFHIRL
jgi:hypothetical protein